MADPHRSAPPCAASHKPTDERLMLNFAGGDYGAFEHLYQRHRRPLFRFMLRALNGQHALTEELFQDVWTRLIDARAGYQASARFTTYLYRIAHNRVIDYYRAKRPSSSDHLEYFVNLMTDSPLQPDQQLEQASLGADLRQAIAALPESQRSALLLQAERGLSLDQIAHISGVGRETVKSRRRYATSKLKRMLRGMHEQAT